MSILENEMIAAHKAGIAYARVLHSSKKAAYCIAINNYPGEDGEHQREAFMSGYLAQLRRMTCQQKT